MGNPKLGPTPSGTGAIAKMRLVRAPGHGQKCLVWYFRKGPLETNQYNQIQSIHQYGLFTSPCFQHADFRDYGD